MSIIRAGLIAAVVRLVRLLMCCDVCMGVLCRRRRGHRGKHAGQDSLMRLEWEAEE